MQRTLQESGQIFVPNTVGQKLTPPCSRHSIQRRIRLVPQVSVIWTFTCKTFFLFRYSEHPYLFFNQDRVTMSFLGFTVNRYGDLMDKINLNVITRAIMHPNLYQGLHRQGVELFSQYDKWPRYLSLEFLRIF